MARALPRLLRSSIAFALVFVLLIGLHLIGWLRPIESGVSFVLEPVARGARTLVNRVGNTLHLLGRISELDSENERLTQDLEKARAQIAKLQEDQAELASLREREHAPIPQEIQTIGAHVIGHDGISGTKRLTINRGSKDGVKEGMPVISSGGTLLGTVDAVLAGQAEILLLADDRSSIPSRIAEARATGIVRGELGLGLKMTDIPQQETVHEGDRVVTSGLGGDIPAGIPVGTVETVEAAANALFQVARVQPLVDVTTQEFVYVITNQS
ncbi:MAG: rod shape-determining protein MreC [Candidatus Andersenbacteria bacterium]